MMAAIFNLAILDSAILVFPLKLTHTCQDWFTPFPKKKKKLHSLFPLHHLHKILHSFNLINLMMAAILNSAILDSAILHKTLTQTNSIWLKLIHSDLTWWWQPSWTLPSWIHPFCTKLWLKLIQSDSNSLILIQLDDGNHLEFCQLDSAILQRINFTHFFWLNLMMAAIFNSAMLDSAITILVSDTLLSYLRFAQKHSHSNLTLNQTNSIWLKLIHSHLTWWWQPSWILPTWIPLYWIQPS